MALVTIERQLFEYIDRMQLFLRQLWAMIGKIVESQSSVIVRIGPITLHYVCFNTIRFGTVWISKSAVLVHTVHGRLFCNVRGASQRSKSLENFKTLNMHIHTRLHKQLHKQIQKHIHLHIHIRRNTECVSACLHVCRYVCLLCGSRVVVCPVHCNFSEMFHERIFVTLKPISLKTISLRKYRGNRYQ